MLSVSLLKQGEKNLLWLDYLKTDIHEGSIVVSLCKEASNK